MHIATKFVLSFGLSWIAWGVLLFIGIITPSLQSKKYAPANNFETFLGLWLLLNIAGLFLSGVAMIWTR